MSTGEDISRELKEHQKIAMAQMKDTEPAVMVSDRNWKGVIRAIENLTKTMTDAVDILKVLATYNEIQDLLSDQVEQLTEKDENAVETMQEKLSEIRSELKTGTEGALNEISKLAGKKKEEFSSAYSMMENRMTRFTKKLIWISLIPSAALIVSALLRLILQLVWRMF